MKQDFELILFATDPPFVKKAIHAGVDSIIVDWENLGKEGRQRGADTQINHDSPEDLMRVRAATDAKVICRINNWPGVTPLEIEKAIAGGADEILLPMVREPSEVGKALDQVRGRCGLGILVETDAAVTRAEELGSLPVSRVYVGLNDLAIERKTENIFSALIDGTLERIRRAFSVPFGFGGLTLPEGGHPIPCRLLMGEMARLSCQFSFLRRSFLRDIQGYSLLRGISSIGQAIQKAKSRSPGEVRRDRFELAKAIRSWRSAPVSLASEARSN